jgi:proline racemase|tara:strand:- start:3165 stop:3515 length:351 start_codon:yes stop_codon:yes gene_type:complete
MEDYIAIVKTSNNKVDKYQDFSNKSDADAHVATHGGFVVDNPGGDISYWIVNASEKSVTFDKSTSDADVALRTIMKKIENFEREITPRRIRDAILGTDDNWLKNKEAEIATERGKL